MNKSHICAIIVVAVIVIAAAAFALTRDDSQPTDDGEHEYTYQTYKMGGELITQTIDGIPERVIVGNVAALEMMLEFDLGDRIVALMYYDLFYDTNCVTPPSPGETRRGQESHRRGEHILQRRDVHGICHDARTGPHIRLCQRLRRRS